MPIVIEPCAVCGKITKRWKKENELKQRMFCSRACYCALHHKRAHENPNGPGKKAMTAVPARIRITKQIPVFQELCPVVGGEYPAKKYASFGCYAGGYVIKMGEKWINIRRDECIEI